MSRRDPKRLRIVAGSALERRSLASAADEEPSAEQSDRMAKALGVSAAAVGGAAVAAATARAAAAKGAASASASTISVLPWISAGVVAVVAAGAIVAVQAWRAPIRPSPPLVTPLAQEPSGAVEVATAVPTMPVPTGVPAGATEARPDGPATLSGRRARAAANPPDLRDQTALIGAARDAVAAGAADKALALVRQYQERYPGGIFGPEAAALRIESLVKLGRGGEARVLAERFVATHGAGPLTERVKVVAGLARY